MVGKTGAQSGCLIVAAGATEGKIGQEPGVAWVPQRRPTGAPTMTYGRSLVKAMEKFHLDPARWHELAAQRGPWRAMLRTDH